MELASAVSAAEEPYKKTLAGAYRRHRSVSLPMHRITLHDLSIFVCGPVNIAYMMVTDEDAAFFGRARRALALLELTVDQQCCYRTPRPHIGASIERVA